MKLPNLSLLIVLIAIFGIVMSSSEFIKQELEDKSIEISEDEILSLRNSIGKLIDTTTFPTNFKHEGEINERPVIGIFTQTLNDSSDYMMAVYVKFAESAGARVVPINWRAPDEEIAAITEKINGLILPGGSPRLLNKDGTLTEYARKGSVAFNKVKEMNEKGIYMPVWGVCLGLQEIMAIEAPYPDTIQLNKINASDIVSNVDIKEEYKKSKLFKRMPDHLFNALKSGKIAYNHHHSGVLPETMNKYDSLKEYYNLGT